LPQPQRRQGLQQLLELPEQPQLPVDVPPTEPDEQELHPHRRQPQPPDEPELEELLLLLVPPTEPEELPLLQVQEQVQRFELFESLVPPTEPELEFWQQGLQQELATKLGNTMPP